MSKLFPELDLPDAAPAPLALGPPRAIARPVAPPEFGRAKPITDGKDALSRALAIPTRAGHKPARVKLFDAFPKERRILIEIEGGGWPDLAFFVVPRGEASGVHEGEHLTFVMRGKAIDPVRARILQHCAMRLKKTPWSSIYALAMRDPKSEPTQHGPPPEEGMPMPGMVWPPNDVDVEYLNSLGFGYSPAGAWRNFIVGHENNYGGIENSRGYCQKVHGKIAGVSHTEIECRMSSPTGRNGTLEFWNHAEPDLAGETHAPDRWIELFSDLSEIDVIKGGHTKLDRMLDALVESGEEPDLVVLTSTCTTTVIGDDTVGAIERMRQKKPLRVINMAETRDVTLTLFEQSRAKPSFLTAPKVPCSINLLGLPKLVGQVGLLEMLRDAGIAVNAWILPEMRSEDVDRFMSAELTVLYDWAALDRAYEGMLSGLPIRTVRPPPPIGIEGTRNWLATIGEGLGIRERTDRVWDAHFARHEPSWTALSRRARGYRLGFVGEERLLGRYLSSRQVFGFAVLELLEEMGFGIDLYLVPASGQLPEPRIEQAQGRRVIWTASAEELERDLASADAVAFYSEIFFDRRLTRTGRNLFSVREFGRLGLEGAVDGLRRMLRACEMPFFRTYGAYFGSPFAIGPGK